MLDDAFPRNRWAGLLLDDTDSVGDRDNADIKVCKDIWVRGSWDDWKRKSRHVAAHTDLTCRMQRSEPSRVLCVSFARNDYLGIFDLLEALEGY